MPFGLRNAPASFQQTLYFIISVLRFTTCLVYLNDVLIFSKSVEDQMRHIDEVVQLLQVAGVSLKLRKFPLLRESVDYRGDVLLPG